MNISETVTKIRNGEINVVDLVREHIEKAKESHKNLNDFITILEDSALEQANALDEKIQSGEIEDLELLGIPFTVKDLYLVEDTKTTFGSKYMQDFIAPYTSTVVQKCLDAGAVLIGKTNCDPWGFGSTGENSGYGATKNPVNTDYVPGGSSSGSAASLADGVGFFSLGTDTGGSVRLPASYCGIYAYKPTYGRNSRFGIGVMGSSFDTPGFFTRNVEDIEVLEKIMQGKDENDRTTDDFSKYETKNGKKIGIPKEFFEIETEKEIKDLIDAKIEKLKNDGYEIIDISIPSIKYGLAAYYVLVPSEISANRARYDGVRFGPFESEEYEKNLVEGRSKYFEEEVIRRIMIGTYSLSAGYSDQFYNKASKVRTKLKQEFDSAFEKVDFIISPISPSTPPKLGENDDDPIKNYLLDIFNVTANLVGVPSIAIPVGKDSKDLPVGMQIMTSRFNDFELFRNW